MTAKQKYQKLQSHFRVSVLYTLHHINLPMVLLRGIENGLGKVPSPVPKVSETETRCKFLPYYQKPEEASEATTEAVLSLRRKISNSYRMSKEMGGRMFETETTAVVLNSIPARYRASRQNPSQLGAWWSTFMVAPESFSLSDDDHPRKCKT
ncbi:hypothetical protein BDR22DRAFT_895288 [Usnea florida]